MSSRKTLYLKYIWKSPWCAADFPSEKNSLARNFSNLFFTKLCPCFFTQREREVLFIKNHRSRIYFFCMVVKFLWSKSFCELEIGKPSQNWKGFLRLKDVQAIWSIKINLPVKYLFYMCTDFWAKFRQHHSQSSSMESCHFDSVSWLILL